MASTIKADTLQSTTSNVFVLNSAGTEYARFNSSGNLQLAGAFSANGNVTLSAANTKILNSSGNPILQQTGSVLQVVQSTTTTTASNGSNNNATATGLSVTITPTSTTSRILVFSNWGWSCSTVDFGYYAYRVNSTLDTTSSVVVFNQTSTNATNSLYFASLNKIYSPGTISAQTYELVFYNGNAPTQTSYFNQRAIGGAPGLCTMTAMEIAA
jgi:hypothetical protein